MSHYKPYPAYKDSGVEWLGRVPEYWQLKPLKYVGSAIIGLTYSPDDLVSENEGTLVLRSSNIQNGRIFFGDNVFVNTKIPRALVTRLGDILICSRNGSRALIGKNALIDSASVGISFGAFTTVFRSSANAFVYYVLNSELFRFQSGRFLTTTINQLTTETLNSFEIPLPPPAEQLQIASSLDRETARIDALIEKKTRFIELLREKRQALITHAVTKGLDPSAKMKDSGVEWLGEVPEHWSVKHLKHVVDPNSSITYGIVQAGPEYEGGVPYIRTSDMSGDELPVSGYPLTSPEVDESYARSRVRPGDIVMSIRASVGKCLPVPDELSLANLTQGTAKVSPGQNVTRDFLLEFLNSGAAQVYFELMAKGATFKEITLDALRRTPVLLPPRDEQVGIDRFIALHVGRLDRLVRLSECSVVTLKERRCALITAAVTGQIDLREVV
jgi:type I restriction enzyme S subunit